LNKKGWVVKRHVCFALLCAIPSVSFAGYYTPKVQEFINCTAYVPTLLRLQYQTGKAKEAQEEVDAARKCLDDKVAAAVEEAGDAADFRAAIKDFYVKAQAHISVMFDSERSEEAAGQAQFEAAQKMKLEAKLAGKTESP
jgi:hypothetical protein